MIKRFAFQGIFNQVNSQGGKRNWQKQRFRKPLKRLPIYYRYLNILHDLDKNRVSSTELSEAAGV